MRSRSPRRLAVTSVAVLAAWVAAAQAASASWIPENLEAWQPGLEMIQAGREEEGFKWILDRQQQQLP